MASALVTWMGQPPAWMKIGWWHGDEWPYMCGHRIEDDKQTCDCGRFARIMIGE